MNESPLYQALRIEAAQKGGRLWRNNVGALQDARGRWVRYGLANDSKQVNEALKSSDLVGIMPQLILPEHVGHTFGRFVCREVKAPDWHYTGTPREVAQKAWLDLINSLGGDARFATKEGTL